MKACATSGNPVIRKTASVYRMMTSSNGNIFRVSGHLCGEFTEFPAQRPVTRSFDVFLDLSPNKRWSKQMGGWWFETPSFPLRRHRNGGAWDCRPADPGMDWVRTASAATSRRWKQPQSGRPPFNAVHGAVVCQGDTLSPALKRCRSGLLFKPCLEDAGTEKCLHCVLRWWYTDTIVSIVSCHFQNDTCTQFPMAIFDSLDGWQWL